MSDDDVVCYKVSGDFEVSNSEKKEKKKKKKEANKKLLSFGGDENEEEGPEFVMKQSKPKKALPELETSHKKHRHSRASKANPDLQPVARTAEHTNLRSTAGEYTADKLNALKGNAIHISSSSSSKKVADKLELEALTDSVRSILEDEEDNGFDLKMGRVDDARRKRAIARTVGEENFIPLGPTSTALQPIQKTKAEKRLEEDEDDMAGEYLESYTNNQRIMFGDPGSDRHKKQREEEKRREFNDQRPKKVVVVEDVRPPSTATTKLSTNKQQKPRASILVSDSDSSAKEDDDSEDESFRKFENEQIKKGAGATYVVEKPKRPAPAPVSVTVSQPLVPPTPRGKVTVESIRAKMAQHISDLQEHAAKKSRDFEASKQELAATQIALQGLQVDMARSNQQYQFFQEVRDQVADVLDCSSSKMPQIEQLQDRLLSIQKDYGKALEQHLSLNAADLQREAFNEPLPPTMEGKKDEFGRELSEEEHNRPRRESMRAARRARRLSAEGQAEEGWSTDEDGLETFEAQREAVRQDARRTFEDVTEDYQSVDHVKGIMENWKKEYPEAYFDAFISLSLPALFAPYMRVECLCWKPLSQPHFDILPSYQSLFSFGDDATGEDPDANLLPKLLAKIAIPHVSNLITYQYNPLSSKQTLAVSELLQDCISHLEDNTKGLLEVTKALFGRLAKFVHMHGACKIIPAMKPSDPESEALRKQIDFTLARCRKAIKFFGNLLKFQGMLDGKDLQSLAGSHATDSIVPLLVWLLEREDTIPSTTGARKLVESFGAQLASVDAAKDGKTLGALKINVERLLGAQPQSSAHFIAIGALKDLLKRS